MKQALVLLLLSSAFCWAASSQRPSSGTAPANNVGRSNSASQNSAVDPQFQNPRRSSEPSAEEKRRAREQEKLRNKERQAELERDTDKLLGLATELTKYVDKTNENVLSVDVVRKAEEIEKLAHSVKQKMKE